MSALISTLIILLVVATAMALITRWLRIPYVVGLVVAGLLMPQQLLPQAISLNPDVVLNLFLPILIFEASINTDASRLQSSIKPIGLLAGPGVVLSSVITAVLLKLSLDLAWITAAAVGVILTITDTVSVIAAFRTVKVPQRLATIVEGESLFNDGTALVLLSIISTTHTQGTISWQAGIIQIVIAFGGGGLLGLGLGYLCVGLFRQLDDALSNILLTVAVSLGTFQLGQGLGVSGAIAVVTAGLVIGNLGFKQTAASTKVTLLNFWEYAGFGVNTFIFLLVGIAVDPLLLFGTIPAALWAICCYQIGRILTIYPLLWLIRPLDRPLPLRWQHVLILGNIKGSLSMALALTLPLTLPEQSRVIALVFSTVLISFIAQGVSLPWLVQRLQLAVPAPQQERIETLQLNLVSAKAAQAELKQLLQSGKLPKFIYEELFAQYQAKIAVSEQELSSLYSQRANYISTKQAPNWVFTGLLRRLYLAEKASVNEAIIKGLLTNNDIAQQYIRELDEKLLALQDDG